MFSVPFPMRLSLSVYKAPLTHLNLAEMSPSPWSLSWSRTKIKITSSTTTLPVPDMFSHSIYTIWHTILFCRFCLLCLPTHYHWIYTKIKEFRFVPLSSSALRTGPGTRQAHNKICCLNELNDIAQFMYEYFFIVLRISEDKAKTPSWYSIPNKQPPSSGE